MNPVNFWLGRKKASLCILLCLCAISLCVIFYADGSTSIDSGAYSVRIRHYGVDAADMERNITIPLEDALSAISGVSGVQSTSENSLSRVFVRFGGGTQGQYEAVREAVQRVYEALPPSVQRPEIQSSDDSRIPVWSAAVFPAEGNSADTAFFLERTVKPGLESLDGTGEVLVSGTGLKEIVITLDQEKLAALGLDPSDAAAALAMNDGLFAGGTFAGRDRDLIVTVDSRLGLSGGTGTFGASSLEKALVPLGSGKAAVLSSFAVIRENEREPDILSRLNGKKTAVVSVMAAPDADLRKLSRNIGKELAAMPTEWEFTVLADRGAEEAAAFRSVFNAALQGACMVAFIGFLLNRKARNGTFSFGYMGVFCAMAVPAICLVSVAVLSLLGFPPDRIVLAGIAAGIGGAVDPVILCSEKLRHCKTLHEAATALKQLRGPLAAGAVTTVAALMPLSVMSGSVKSIACAIDVVTVTALGLSLSLLPPLLLWNSGASPAFLRQQTFILPKRLYSVFRFCKRLLFRFIARNAGVCIRHPALVLAAAAVFSAAAVFALFFRGVDAGSMGSENSVYAQVEFDGGLLATEADRLLAEYGEKLSRVVGIKNVETGARTGSGSILVSFNPAKLTTDQARRLIRELPIPGGFVFIPETGSGERYWTIKIFGDSDAKCRELAEQLAGLCAGLPLIRDRVLNFKEGSKKLVMLPDRERLAEAGVPFSQAAEKARLGVFAPVAYKRIGDTGEIDVRIGIAGGMSQAAESLTRQSISGDKIPGLLAGNSSSGGIRLDSLVRIKEDREPSSIRREDRRRSASITVSTGRMDPRRVKQELAGVLGAIELPPGYSLEFDPEAIRQAEALSGTVFSLLLAITFCYMVIAAINESFMVPLAVLSAVPPSLAVPALYLAVTGNPFNPAAACAFVAVSGMTVNAAILCVTGMNSAFRQGRCSMGLYRVLRQKMPALLATSGTTVAGALPFLFLREEANSLVQTLSLVGALGVAASCFCALNVVPAFFIILSNFLNQIAKNRIFRLSGKNN